MTQYQNTVDETFGIQDENQRAMAVFLADTFGLDEDTTFEQVANLIDTVGVTLVIDTLLTGYVNVADGVGFEDVFDFIIELIATDQLGLQDVSTAKLTPLEVITDALGIAGVVETKLNAVNVISAVIALADILERGIDVDVLDGIGLNATVLGLLHQLGDALDTIGIQDSTSNSLGVYLSASELLGLDDDLTFNQTVHELLEEGVSFAVTMISPTGDISTGWVMNSENMAVTTYEDYNFNDMALINGNYYGTNSTGLHLLDGDTDSGDFIEAIVRSAKMDLGTSNLKGMTQAYLGFDGDGNPVLKIITDEKEETWYNVQESRTDLHTARIRLGKGQIGRYWQWELVTRDSTKIELDTIELFPIVWKRKV